MKTIDDGLIAFWRGVWQDIEVMVINEEDAVDI